MPDGKIVVLGTGGTIAGLAPDPRRSGVYEAARLGIGELLQAVEVPVGCEVQIEQVAQVDSKDMDQLVWQALLQRCRHWLTAPGVRGLVVTHGSDTLEETAWLLETLLAPRCPLVLTCAMRPANAPDADGPRNLRDALRVAASAPVQGVVAVCAGQMHSARAVQKVHPTRVDAFSSGDAGPLGRVDGTGVHLDGPQPAQAPGWSAAELDALLAMTRWPRVEIVMSHAMAGGAVVDALIDGAMDGSVPPLSGLVVAGTGNGTIHRAMEPALERAAARGVAVVRASRCAFGAVDALPYAGAKAWPVALGLSAVKARVDLMLALARDVIARSSGKA